MSYTFDSRAYAWAKRQKHAELFWELNSSGFPRPDESSGNGAAAAPPAEPSTTQPAGGARFNERL